MSSVAVAQPGARWSPGRLSPRTAIGVGAVLVVLALVWASTRGAYAIAPAQLWQVLLQALGAAPSAEQAPEYLVFINIRLPRLRTVRAIRPHAHQTVHRFEQTKRARTQLMHTTTGHKIHKPRGV